MQLLVKHASQCGKRLLGVRAYHLAVFEEVSSVVFHGTGGWKRELSKGKSLQTVTAWLQVVCGLEVIAGRQRRVLARAAYQRGRSVTVGGVIIVLVPGSWGR